MKIEEIVAFKWFSDMGKAPKDGTPILVFNREWINEDSCPTGITEGFWSHYGKNSVGWITVAWDMEHDCYDTIYGSKPTHWAYMRGPIE